MLFIVSAIYIRLTALGISYNNHALDIFYLSFELLQIFKFLGFASVIKCLQLLFKYKRFFEFNYFSSIEEMFEQKEISM